jgi:hypothetical protein
VERIKEFTIVTPGPDQQPKRLKPFVAVPFTNNPWSLCKPEYRDAILVTYGHIWKYAQMLTVKLTEGDRYWLIERRRIHRFRDGRSIEIHLRTMRDGSAVIGGWIRLKNARGVSVKIQDVKSLFHTTWRKLAKMYRCDDLAAIMERTRESLTAVGITASRQNWSLCSSLTDYVWKHHEINLADVPAVSSPKGPGNLQGYYVFGHTDHPVYSYDIRSAYLSVMAEFPALRPFTDHIWSARRELEQAGEPAAYLLKLAATVMPGKFTSTLDNNPYYRPVLGNYIRQRVNARLTKAMDVANSFEAPTWLNVYRWCVDGFIAFTDISRFMNTGDDLGQWKPVKRHERLTIMKTNVWWTDLEYKDGGFNVTEADALAAIAADEPFAIRTSRTIFDWSRLEERIQPVTLRQIHQGLACRKCWEDDGRELHDRFG